MTARLPDAYFDAMYATSDDPWQLSSRWYEERKYAITLSMLPRLRYRHAFEPGCSIGTLTERLAVRCDAITATDVSAIALDHADRRLRAAGRRGQVNLMLRSLDDPWPEGDFDLIVISEVGYYLHAENLRSVLDRERSRLNGVTVVAAHWRHPVEDYPMGGDRANQIIAATPGLLRLGSYRDPDVAIEIFAGPDGSASGDQAWQAQ